jgi:6-phosphofructokinase 1
MNNILIGQSGGPTVTINATLAGIIDAAKKSSSVDKIYGAINGIIGVINQNVYDLSDISSDDSKKLVQTPAMALGSCRHKLADFSESLDVYEKILATLKKYDIKCFYYIGGNDSMDTVLKLNDYFKFINSNIKAVGVLKTIDNDLCETDHTPGFGSAAKYICVTVNEIIKDAEIYPGKNVIIIEIMGRDSGWLTLAAGLPKFLGNKKPHMILLPEVPFSMDVFIENVRLLLQNEKSVVIAVSEGIKDSSGNYVGESTKNGKEDIFGHLYLSGVAKYLESVVSETFKCKCRGIELNILQRCSSHLASKTDLEEAFSIGDFAIKEFSSIVSGDVIVYKRVSNNPYSIKLETCPVENIANKVKAVPKEWLDLESKDSQKQICDYLLPLIKGGVEPILDIYDNPVYFDINN